ncbi:hypothetical protein AA309_02660 [Microvirga vignae]|uniref:Uncharacterized protein n=1 Tax=Microvirga vignae TaxID=1225564 RepID=A0A0H1RIC5_9HYPH|nr:hypothetical protein AA309_02660 [Microvirga vignae]
MAIVHLDAIDIDEPIGHRLARLLDVPCPARIGLEPIFGHLREKDGMGQSCQRGMDMNIRPFGRTATPFIGETSLVAMVSSFASSATAGARGTTVKTPSRARTERFIKPYRPYNEGVFSIANEA